MAPKDLGIYLSLYGVVTATNPAAGLGAPDGFVRWYPELVDTGQEQAAADLLGSYLGFCAISCLAVASCIGVVAWATGGDGLVGLIVSGWWLGYAAAYVGSQALVGVGRTKLGTFIYYGSINWLALIALGVYLLMVPRVTLVGVLTAATVGSLAAGLGSLFLLRRFASFGGISIRPPRSLLSVGAMIALGRGAQSLLIWSPVWVTGLMFSAADAATVGLASRLVMAVGAAVAAVRFSLRPQLVKLAVNDRWGDIESLGRRIAIACTALCVATLLGNIVVGPFLLPRVFGAHYTGLSFAITVLLIGVTIESAAGPTDEVLKMTDGARFVFWSQGAAVAIAFAAEIAVGLTLGATPVLAVFSACFGALYVAIAAEVYRRRRVVPAWFLGVAVLRRGASPQDVSTEAPR